MATVDHLLRVPAVIIDRARTGPVDRFGTPTWEELPEVPAECWYHPASSEEQLARPAGVVQWVAYFPLTVTIATTSRLTIDGRTFEVLAPPLEWRHPVSREGFQRVEMVEGPTTPTPEEAS